MILDHKITSINSQGNLLVDTRPWLDRQFLITNWNYGVRFYLKNNELWQQEELDPGIVLISDEHLKQRNEPIADFLKQIPDEVIEQLKPFAYRQFTLLNFLSQNPTILDIFKHSANLVWLTIIMAEQKKWSKESIFKLLHQKRESVIAKLFFDSTPTQARKPIVRFLDKIKLFEANEQEYRLIKKSIIDENIIKAFSHWKVIPIQALAVVNKYPGFLNTKLLSCLVDDSKEIAIQIRPFGVMNIIMSDIREMADIMEVNLPENYFQRFTHKNDMDVAHDRIVERFNVSEKVREKEIVIFPDCPIGDKETLKQIKNSFDLTKEGRDMHHCVGGYIRPARTGQYYFYKVLAPERGTMQISVKDNKVSIIQFKLACNKQPSEETLFNVRQLLVS